MLTVGKDGSIIETLKEILEKYLKGASPKYYPPVENLLDLIYEHYTENNSVAPQTTEAGKDAKQKEKDLETWLRGIAGMDVLVEDYGGDIPLEYSCADTGLFSGEAHHDKKNIRVEQIEHFFWSWILRRNRSGTLSGLFL